MVAIKESVGDRFGHFNLAISWRAVNSKDRSTKGAADFVEFHWLTLVLK
jgi:hypothetical protein